MGKITKINSRVRIQPTDWDNEARLQLLVGKGFRIRDKGKTDKNPDPHIYSIHSPLYGTDWGDDHAFEDRYSCKCGNYIGKNFIGSICPMCKTEVEFIDVDMTKTGWIVLDRDKIIQPLFYQRISNFIGGSRGKQVSRLDLITKYIEPEKRQVADNEREQFTGIGMIEFYERFDEIMQYFLSVNKSPKKYDEYTFIMMHKDRVFVSHIPVYSTFLRPFSISGDEIKYTKEDKLFRSIYQNSELLNKDFILENRINRRQKQNKDIFQLRHEVILRSIQEDINKLWELTFNSINKKTGFIRSNVIGGRLNYTARNVIIPDKDLKADEISMGYVTFLELYKLEIISLITKVLGVSDVNAWYIWEGATVVFNERIYNIMIHMITTQELYCLVNRNPTIEYGSEVLMKIVKISPNINDNVMSLPIAILPLLNADFDGDVLNIRCEKIDHITKNYIKQASPRYNHFISRNDGLFNISTGIYRDQVVGLYSFANIDIETDTDMDYTDILSDDSLLEIKI